MAYRRESDTERVGQCGYIKALDTLERLTGSALATDLLAGNAAECAGERCLLVGLCHASSEPHEGRPPIPLPSIGSTRARPSARRGADSEKLAFSRRAGFDILADDLGNRFERRLLPLDRIDEAPALAALLRYWQWLRSVTPCRLRDIDVAHLIGARLIGNLHIADVVSADPDKFTFALIAHALPMDIPTRVSRLPVPICADATMRDYNTTRLTAAPRLQRIRARLNGVHYHYTRLILPFMDQRERVSHLAVAIHREPGDAVRAMPSGSDNGEFQR